jgi:thermostable 8-oxoguanine DNA glycosylase
MVVGRSRPYEKFTRSAELKNEIAYDTLIGIRDEEQLKRKINQVLLAVGTRYASSDISKCVKTKALVHNLRALMAFENGPKGFLAKLSGFSGVNADKDRIKYVMNQFMFIKNKGARDFLMELGIAKNAIAFDTRVQRILENVGIETPKDYQSNPKLYDELEDNILTKICKPLGMTGVEFDRMLYQNYEDIMRM